MATGNWRAAVALAFSFMASAAVAGPPYETDDPEPTERGHWEIYAFTAAGVTAGELEGVAGLDLNYGPSENLQLTATVPLDFTNSGTTHAGLGDLEVGVKYRFFHDDKAGLSIATFPRLILPTAGRRFGTGRAAFLLPVWAQKDIGPWALFGGGGYTINPGAGNRDFWQTGLAVTRKVSPRLSLGGEVTHQSPEVVGAGSSNHLGVGGIYDLGGPFALLFSGGPAFEHHSRAVELRGYVALGMSY